MADSRFEAFTRYAAPGYENLGAFLDSGPSAETLRQSNKIVEALAFRGTSLIVRKPGTRQGYEEDSDVTPEWAIRLQAEALRRGLGKRGLEQMVYYDAGQLVVVTKRAPGTVVEAMTPSQVQRISDNHIAELLTTADEARVDQIVLDSSSDNSVHHPSIGFTVFDYAPLLSGSTVEDMSPGKVELNALTGMVEDYTMPSADPAVRALKDAWFDVFTRGSDILLNRHPGLLDELDASDYARELLINPDMIRS